jgi:hypothetical protein
VSIFGVSGTYSGSSTLYAAIGVTYPSGSTCTCTNGTTTFSDSNTDGQVVFSIPSAGTWTVSCTNGTKTATKSVKITADGQCEDIELMYEYVVLSAANGLASNFDLLGAYISPAIDVTSYSTLKITGRMSWSEYTADVHVCLTANPNSVSSTNIPASKITFPYSTSETTKSIDLSGLSGNMYLGFYFSTAYVDMSLAMLDDGKLEATTSSGRGLFSSIIFE